jgi:hypothetical protein
MGKAGRVSCAILVAAARAHIPARPAESSTARDPHAVPLSRQNVAAGVREDRGQRAAAETSVRVRRFAATHSRTTDRLAVRVVWSGRRLQEHLT